jgi:hypothetical protein
MKIKLTLLAMVGLFAAASAANAGPQFGIYISSGGGNCSPRPNYYAPRPVYYQPVYYSRPVVTYSQGYNYGYRDCDGPRYVKPRKVKRCDSYGWRH